VIGPAASPVTRQFPTVYGAAAMIHRLWNALDREAVTEIDHGTEHG
jgi:hypothetical protein